MLQGNVPKLGVDETAELVTKLVDQSAFWELPRRAAGPPLAVDCLQSLLPCKGREQVGDDRVDVLIVLIPADG
ncbi:hypothetical protein EPN81_00675 [Patescibacteria group bacterium]|nr:MAG: hypothetical protein EPN81_00675 [Patescibacteria group bacterium]